MFVYVRLFKFRAPAPSTLCVRKQPLFVYVCLFNSKSAPHLSPDATCATAAAAKLSGGWPQPGFEAFPKDFNGIGKIWEDLQGFQPYGQLLAYWNPLIPLILHEIYYPGKGATKKTIKSQMGICGVKVEILIFCQRTELTCRQEQTLGILQRYATLSSLLPPCLAIWKRRKKKWWGGTSVYKGGKKCHRKLFEMQRALVGP